MKILLQIFLLLFLYEICYAQTTTHHSLQIGNSTLHFDHSLELQFPYSFKLFWTANPQSLNATFGVLAQTVAPDGYVAVGFSPDGKMVNSRALIAISTTGKNSIINDVKITAKALYGLNASHPVTFDHQVQYMNDHMAMSFSIPLTEGNLSFNNSCGIIYAVGHAVGGMIERHVASHSAQIMLSGEVIYDNNRAIKVTIHAAMMTVAWMILTPLAAFFASPQFRKRLFPNDKASNPKYIRAHRYTIAIAIIAAAIGFLIGVFVIGTRTFIVHFTLGMAVIGVMLVQASLGFWRTTIYPNRRSEFRVKGMEKVGRENRHMIASVHTWLGRLLYVMAVVNVVFGQLAYQDYGTVGLVMTGILAAVGCALFLVGPVSSVIARE